ncbi:hypothetical protein CSKR_202259 [Clonorchis sinensis]|uniref:Uncharacterized protein n=1 Tax=Clonorchis sinensis TaxID=79923 RepID=A0A8T1LYR4_CLOSI|nr:hypothetical protein CSKR_202259 [Clonorchis sinensis]
MTDRRTVLYLLACIAVQQIVSLTISEEEKTNLKAYKDYWGTFFLKARDFMNSIQPNTTILDAIRTDAENFDTITKNMIEFTNPTVKNETDRIKSFPKKLLGDVAGMTQTLENNTVVWIRTTTAVNNRRALNSRLHKIYQKLNRRFRNWKSKHILD